LRGAIYSFFHGRKHLCVVDERVRGARASV
jgi:hypothetical protein